MDAGREDDTDTGTPVHAPGPGDVDAPEDVPVDEAGVDEADAAPTDGPALDATDQPLAPPRRPLEPELPFAPARPPTPMVDPLTKPAATAAARYRSDEERNRSVYRRANPWYRRLARGLIGTTLLAALAVGVYAGARAVQNYLERDRLPSPGAEVPEFRSATFLLTSAAPAPELDGTLTIDTSTEAFEFVGRVTGPQAGLQVVSADGETLYIRRGDDRWRTADGSDDVADAARLAVAYLADDDNADDILTNRLRRGYASLVDQVDEGVGADRLTRYEMLIDTAAFSRDYPLQWEQFRDDAIPGVGESSALPVTIWLDTEGLLVRVRDAATNWAWERLATSDQPFVVEPPADATAALIEIACVAGDVSWQSPLPTCDEAAAIGRRLAAATGVVESIDDPAADITVATLCAAMSRDDGQLPVSSDEAALATALVDSGVCTGDPTIFSVADAG